MRLLILILLSFGFECLAHRRQEQPSYVDYQKHARFVLYQLETGARVPYNCSGSNFVGLPEQTMRWSWTEILPVQPAVDKNATDYSRPVLSYNLPGENRKMQIYTKDAARQPDKIVLQWTETTKVPTHPGDPLRPEERLDTQQRLIQCEFRAAR